MNDFISEARKVASEWYADKRHDTQMSGYAMELLVERIALVLQLHSVCEDPQNCGIHESISGNC